MIFRRRRRPPPPPHPRTEDALYNHFQGPNELDGVTIGLSLSGGGYRASLFAAGAVAALIEGGLWPQVRWTASVSGGSFINAAAALELSSAPSRADLDGFLHRVAARTRSPGTLVGRPGSGGAIRGPSLVARCYQAGIERTWLGSAGRALVRLRDLQREDRIHAFLAVDLASLTPVFLTDRLVHSVGLIEEGHVAHEPGELPLVSAVRASASFPGMPAVRVTARDLGAAEFPMYEDLHLGDGGVWNNLATHWEAQIGWLRRDLFDIPHLVPRKVDAHVVVDASSRGRRPQRWRTGPWFTALDRPVASLDRTLHAAFQSTVEANRRALRDANGEVPRRILHVAMGDLPHDAQPLGALLRGASREDWFAVMEFNNSVGTAWPTFAGIPPTTGVHVMAHGYAQMASMLTARGVPFERFEVPHERIAQVFG